MRSFMRDVSLNRHRDPVARILGFQGNLARHFRSARAFFLRILEYSEALKSSAPDEIKKAGEFLFGFAGKSDDESGTQRHARNSSAQLVDQTFDVLTRSFSSHAPQHRLVDMLQRNIDIASDPVALRDGADQFVTPVRWVRIKQAHPEVPLDFLNFANKAGKRWAAR